VDVGDEPGDLADPLLEQVADPCGVPADQLQGVAALDELGEHEDPGVRPDETDPGGDRPAAGLNFWWSRLGESNPRPTHYECVALTD
jgi:hypothetical protein